MDLEKAVMAASRLRTELHAAEQYVQHVFNDRQALDCLTIKTTVVANGRRSDHDGFDSALEEVMRDEFPRLASLALARMAGEYRRAMLANKGELEAALAEIKCIEAKEQEPVITKQAQASTDDSKYGFAGTDV